MRTEKGKPPAMGSHSQSWHHLGSASPNLAWLEAPGEVSTLQHPRVPSPLLSLVPGHSLVTKVAVMTVPPSDDLSSALSSHCLMCHISPSILDFPQDLRTAMALCKLESQGHPIPPLPPSAKMLRKWGKKKKKIPCEQMVGGTEEHRWLLGPTPGVAVFFRDWILPAPGCFLKAVTGSPGPPYLSPVCGANAKGSGSCWGLGGSGLWGSNPHLHPPQGSRGQAGQGTAWPGAH